MLKFIENFPWFAVLLQIAASVGAEMKHMGTRGRVFLALKYCGRTIRGRTRLVLEALALSWRHVDGAQQNLLAGIRPRMKWSIFWDYNFRMLCGKSFLPWK